MLHPSFTSHQRIHYRRIFIELCRYFLELKETETALSLIIQVLKIYTLDEELYAALARLLVLSFRLRISRTALRYNDKVLAYLAFLHIIEINPLNYEGVEYLRSHHMDLHKTCTLDTMMDNCLFQVIKVSRFSDLNSSTHTLNSPEHSDNQQSVRLSQSIIWDLQVLIAVTFLSYT